MWVGVRIVRFYEGPGSKEQRSRKNSRTMFLTVWHSGFVHTWLISRHARGFPHMKQGTRTWFCLICAREPHSSQVWFSPSERVGVVGGSSTAFGIIKLLYCIAGSIHDLKNKFNRIKIRIHRCMRRAHFPYIIDVGEKYIC
jgi:hypothetical protein